MPIQVIGIAYLEHTKKINILCSSPSFGREAYVASLVSPSDLKIIWEILFENSMKPAKLNEFIVKRPWETMKSLTWNIR